MLLRSFGQDTTKLEKSVEERKGKFLFADLGRYWSKTEGALFRSSIPKSLAQGAQWIEEGKLKPYINRIIKLEEAENTLEQFKQGKVGFGKVVVKLL